MIGNRQKIWVLLDDRPGTANQCLAVAEALQKPFITIATPYSFLACFPNELLWFLNKFWPHCLMIAGELMIDDVCPDAIISAGRRSAYVARWIKRRFNDKPRIAQIMDPKWRRADFDVLAIPLHDDVAIESKNVIRTLGNPHRLSQARLEDAQKKYQSIFSDLPKTKIAVLLGGKTKHKGLNDLAAIQLLSIANKCALSHDAGLLISSSRRTSKSVIAAIPKTITAPRYVYDWHAGGENPYAAILSAADMIIVSGDSTAMIADACATGKPVFIFSPPGMVGDKHQRLQNDLAARGFARMLRDEKDLTLAAGNNPPRLDVAGDIARAFQSALL